MPEAAARENYDFFLAHKSARVQALGRLLNEFGVSLDYTEESKTSLDEWLASHAALLYARERGCSFLTRNPVWVGPRAGLNVIFDAAIFLGDFAIHENPGLRWEMDDRQEPGLNRLDEQFQRPVLAAPGSLLSFPTDPHQNGLRFLSLAV